MPGESKPPAQAVASVDSGSGVDDLKESFTAVRSYLSTTGTALGAIATALLTGLGWTQLHDLFPIPEGKPAVAWIAAISAVTAIAAIALVVLRLFAAQRRILISSLLTREGALPAQNRGKQGHRGLSDDEREAAGDVLDRHAFEEGARNLRALELRALRLERISRSRTTDDEAKRFADEAARLHAVVRIASFRAAGQVLERRQEHVFGGRTTKALVLTAALAMVALWSAADYSSGQRDLIDLRSKCAEAVGKGATTACEPVVPEPARDAAKTKAAVDAAAAAVSARAKRVKERAQLADARVRLGDPVKTDVRVARDCIAVIGADLANHSAAVRNAAFAACLARR